MTLIKYNIDILRVAESKANDIKILTIEIKKCSVTSVYKPPGATFELAAIKNDT